MSVNKQAQLDVINRGYFDISDDVNFEGVMNIARLIGFTHISHGAGGKRFNNDYKLWVPHLTVDETKQYKCTNELSDDGNTLIERSSTQFINDSHVGEIRVTFMHMKSDTGHKTVKFIGAYELIENGKTKRVYHRHDTKVYLEDLRKMIND